mmetsp:Transcript_23713/g.53937  ORF Transcript_23713/g.53937 Transcript_23713/m.53937 type:complete len:88 (+) Transcript_23713:421-684(+)
MSVARQAADATRVEFRPHESANKACAMLPPLPAIISRHWHYSPPPPSSPASSPTPISPPSPPSPPSPSPSAAASSLNGILDLWDPSA